MPNEMSSSPNTERTFAYRILRYTSNLVRDEWVNIGVLLFDPGSGERRLRLIEEPEEFRRVRRLDPHADEALLRDLRADLEDRLARAGELFTNSDIPGAGNGDASWQKLVLKWDEILDNALQLAPQKGTAASDLDAELERLYADHVAPQHAPTRVGVPASGGVLRNYCDQVWKQAGIWERIEKNIRLAPFTFPADPARMDYGYRRNGTRGFVQTLSVSRAPNDAKSLAFNVEHIRRKISSSEFTAVTDVPLLTGHKRHDFVQGILRDARVDMVPVEAFAVWVAKMKPLIQ